ncbi:MAG TPA: hypothetical protein DD706_02265 [Nitrospiraceae bacterium]|nr:hypothetical protein [Nitrospiraceae bacterium]
MKCVLVLFHFFPSFLYSLLHGPFLLIPTILALLHYSLCTFSHVADGERRSFMPVFLNSTRFQNV